MNFVTPKAGAKCELLFNKPATEAGSLNQSSCLAAALGVTKSIGIIITNWGTLCCAA
jgi:hypothetical protein